MGLAAAYALCPGLRVRSRDAAAEQEALKRLAQTALEFTPWVSLDQPQSLLLEIRASLHLFGGAERLREKLRQRLLDRGHRPVIAASPSPEASALLARLGVETVVQDRQSLPAALRPVPVAALPLDDKLKQRMARAGIQLLGDLWRLPRDGLARRFGASLLRWLDALAGAETRPLGSFQCPPRFSASRDLPIELERLDHFFPAIAQLAEEFAAFLKGYDAAASGLVLDLSHQSRPATRIELDFRSAHRDAAHWLLLLREKLERSPLPAPVVAVTLRSEAIVPFEPERRDLFGDRFAGFQGDHRGREVLEQLQARLGRHALLRLGTAADHRPERAGLEDVTLTPTQKPAAHGRIIFPAPSGRRWPEEPDEGEGLNLPLRPLWLLSKPEPLETQDIRLLSEPERIEGGWWDGAPIRRDYRVALDRQGRRLWVFRDLNGAGRWYLHGLFG
jgi:protein ImuB